MTETKPTWVPPLSDLPAANALLDQQFWCFGRDITLPPGNALVEYGLQRHPSPQARQDGSCYANRTRRGTVLALWGFGAYFAEEGGIFVPRQSLIPLYSARPGNPIGAWSAQELSMRETQPDEVSSVLTLLARLCRWFAQYEDWIQETRPRGYDTRSLAGWLKVTMPRRRMKEAWRAIAGELETQNVLGPAHQQRSALETTP